MKNLLKKIRDFMGNYPRLFVLLLVFILIIVIFVIYRIADVYMNSSRVIEEKLYTYVGNNKYEFDSKITINKKGVISDIEPNINIDWTSTPLFGDDKIIFPEGMIIVLPQENYLEYRLLPFSYIEKNAIISKDFNSELNDFLLFDTNNTYFFSESGTLKIGEVEIKLDENSYVICEQKRVYYLNKETNEVKSLDINGDVTFKSDSYFVNLKEDTVGIEGHILSKSFDYIDFIANFETLQN